MMGSYFTQLTDSSLQPWWDFMITFYAKGKLELDYDPKPCESWWAPGQYIGLPVDPGYKEDIPANNSCNTTCTKQSQSISSIAAYGHC